MRKMLIISHIRAMDLLDNSCYTMRNIPKMDGRPKELMGEIFDLLFNSAEISRFVPKERSEYIKQVIA